MKSDLTDLEVFLHHRTEKAVLVSIDGNHAAAVWLPLSRIEIETKGIGPAIATITLPQHLAEEKGLV